MLTRDRLITATGELLREVPFKELTTAMVCQRLGLSPPAFYRYFSNLSDALAACAHTMGLDVAHLAGVVEASRWGAGDADDAAGRLIDAFFDFWTRHRGLYRVIDLLADEGDLRFIELRRHMFEPLTAAMTPVIPETAGHRREVTAGILVATLVHVTAREAGFVSSGIDRAELRRHLARHIAAALTVP